MKKNKKNIYINLITIVSILILATSNFVYAEGTGAGSTGEGTGEESGTGEETGGEEQTPEPEVPEEETTTDTDTESNTDTNQENTETTVVVKSSNTNLSNLGIRPNDFSGFLASKTLYEVSVPSTVNTIEVYAEAEHEKATITGIGSYTLTEGSNVFRVTVTAENGNVKTYTINVTKEEKQEDDDMQEDDKEEEKETRTVITGGVPGEGLKTLEIAGIKLEPEFSTNIYEYIVDYEGFEEKLEILTTTTQEGYIVDIVGNNKLELGENIITIFVEDDEGNNIATYQIILDKLYMQVETQNSTHNIPLYVAVVVLIAILITIIVIVIRKKKNMNKHYDDYADENSIENEQDELPRGFDIKRKDENIETDMVKKEINKEQTPEIDAIDKKINEIEKAKKEYLDSFNNQETKEINFDGKRFK